MTNNKVYKFGKYTFKAYCRATGQGWEVGLVCGTKYYFVGNFIHEKEAKKWWSYFNRHISSFAKKYEFADNAPREFYGEFMATYLYREYYNFLSTLFEGYNTKYNKGWDKYSKQWSRYARNFAA
jgi:hypothetical protein